MIRHAANVLSLPVAGYHLVVPILGHHLVIRLIWQRRADRPRRRLARLHGLNQHLLRDIGLS